MHAEHEIGNYNFQNHAHDFSKIVMRAEHEIGNYSFQNCAELKSGFQFSHQLIIK